MGNTIPEINLRALPGLLNIAQVLLPKLRNRQGKLTWKGHWRSGVECARDLHARPKPDTLAAIAALEARIIKLEQLLFTTPVASWENDTVVSLNY